MLTISGVTFGYSASEQQLNGVDLTLPAGETLGLLGPNGAGKTTLVSLIAGLRRPRSGQVLIDGRPPEPGRRELALVPQEYAFYTRLTGRENLAYFAGLLGLNRADARARMDRVLARCELVDAQHQLAGRYSGGMKRRLNLAIALLQQPALLILDEPTAGMDPRARHRLLATLRELNRDGVTLLYTSHLLSEVESLCHSVAVLQAGQVVLSGRLEELLVQQRQSVALKLPTQPPAALVAQAKPSGNHWWQFPLPEAERSLAPLMQALAEADCTPTQVHYGQRPLETVFFEATQRAEAGE